MLKLSIIVPVYNKDDVVEETIKSIINQTFDDFELILVDDGSTDNTLKICENYKFKDNRIKIIQNKHCGVSVARNTGLDMAKGEYIFFCDSDDQIPCDAIENMVTVADKENADFIIGGVENIRISKIKNYVRTYKQLSRKNFTVYEENIEELLEKLWLENNMISAWAKLYRTEVIKKNTIYFNKDLVVLEDFCFVLEFIKKAKKIISIENIVYKVNISDDIISHLHRERSDYVNDVLYAYDMLNDYLKEKKIHDDSVFWKGFYGQFICSYESLWTIKTENIRERLHKYKRIHDVLLKKPFKRFNHYYRKNYSLIRYLSLMHGNVFGLLICNKMGW